MIDANKFTTDFANAELAITPPEMLVEGKRPQKTGITAEQFSRMEREMAKVQGQYKLVAKYLRQHQPDVMEQFEKIVATKSLDQSG